MSKLLGIGILGVLAVGAIKLMSMKTLAGKLATGLSNPRIHKIDWDGISFRTEIRVQNPSRDSMTITKPVVTLTTKGKYLTGNSPEEKSFTIKPLGTTMIDTIEMHILWTALSGYITGILLKIPAMMEAYKNNDIKGIAAALAIPIEMKYTLYAGNLFVESPGEKLM